MGRPTGVTLLAVLHWLEAVMFGLLGVLLLLWARLAADLQGVSFEPAGVPPELLALLLEAADPRVLTIALSIIGLLAVLFVAVGVGLWKLGNWARVTAVVLTGLRLVLLLPGLVYLVIRFDPLGLGLQLLFALIYVWILWYLFQPRVKRAFHVT